MIRSTERLFKRYSRSIKGKKLESGDCVIIYAKKAKSSEYFFNFGGELIDMTQGLMAMMEKSEHFRNAVFLAANNHVKLHQKEEETKEEKPKTKRKTTKK